MSNILLRLPDDLHATLKKMAAREERSLHSFLLLSLRSLAQAQQSRDAYDDYDGDDLDRLIELHNNRR